MNSTNKKTIFDPQNNLTFDDVVIQKMIVLLLKDVDGIIFFEGDDTSGIAVEVGTKQIAVDLTITCEFGKNIPTIFQNILDILTIQLKEMTGLSLVELNIHVADIRTEPSNLFNLEKHQPEIADIPVAVVEEIIEPSDSPTQSVDIIDAEVVISKPKKKKVSKAKTKKVDPIEKTD